MSLQDYIQAHPGDDDATILAAVNAATVVQTDSTPYTWSGLNDRLIAIGVSADVVELLPAFVAAIPGGASFDKMLLSGGVEFNKPGIREKLLAIRGTLDANQKVVIDALLAVGQWNITPWQSWGQSGNATLQQVQQARAIVARESVRTWIVTRYNSVIDQLDAGTVTTISEAKAAMGAN